MTFQVLIAPDKFKGTLTAAAAAAAIARGWRKAHPGDALDLLPMSDGGDGFGGVISALLRARVQSIATVDAAHRPCRAHWWWEPESRTAVIESANVIGLAQLPAKKFHPFALDTFGLGAVIRAARERGARRCIIGIGGSATNDGGFGVARALGWKFLDDAGAVITSWTGLHRLARLTPPRRTQWFEELIVAVDVQNPLLGARGCSRIYGPQKGLRPEDFRLAERCLKRLAEVAAISSFSRTGGEGARRADEGGEGEQCLANEPGTGAAGGLGFGLRGFLGARLEPGFELFARLADLTARLAAANLVITGEGAIDQSTAMGKGVGELARRCRELKIPCLGLAGTVVAARHQKLFAALHGLTDLTTAARAKAKPAYWLERLAGGIGCSRSKVQGRVCS